MSRPLNVWALVLKDWTIWEAETTCADWLASLRCDTLMPGEKQETDEELLRAHLELGGREDVCLVRFVRSNTINEGLTWGRVRVLRTIYPRDLPSPLERLARTESA